MLRHYRRYAVLKLCQIECVFHGYLQAVAAAPVTAELLILAVSKIHHHMKSPMLWNSCRCSVVTLALSSMLTACGGGGGSAATVPVSSPNTPANASTGKAPGVTYSAVGEGTIAAVPLVFDIDGAIKTDNIVYSLAYSSAAGTCTFGGGGDIAACSPLFSGKVFLLCDDTAGSGFQAALLTSEMTVAPVSELAGSTMTGFSCGGQGEVRTVDRTLSFNPDASIAIGVDGGNTWTYGTGTPALLASSTGGDDTGPSLHRWAIYKLAEAGGTTYLLFDLHQMADPKMPDRPAYAYRLKKPS